MEHSKHQYGRGAYVSEFSQFIDDFMRQHPAVVRDQMHGWYIWWDQDVDLDALQKERKDSAPELPYHYE